VFSTHVKLLSRTRGSDSFGISPQVYDARKVPLMPTPNDGSRSMLAVSMVKLDRTLEARWSCVAVIFSFAWVAV
jgi:hypothetical protein